MSALSESPRTNARLVEFTATRNMLLWPKSCVAAQALHTGKVLVVSTALMVTLGAALVEFAILPFWMVVPARLG